MKIHRFLRTTLPALAGLLLTCSAGKAQTTDLIFNTFDSAAETGNWFKFWGGAYGSVEWDAARDASNHVASGSLKFNIAWGANAGDPQFSLGGVDQQGTTWLGAHPVDGTLYTNLVFDILWDTNGPSTGGNYGTLEVGLATKDYGQIGLGTWSPPGDGLWHHLVFPINPTLDGLAVVGGMYAKMWSPANNTAAIPGKFWLDNVAMIAKAGPPPPPPTLIAPSKPIKGLNLIGTDTAGQYGRQSIATLGNTYQWVGNDATDPVTYALTISSYPAPATDGWQTHMFILPHAPGGESAPDWNEPDMIFLDLEQNNSGDGGVTATFRYKANDAQTNDMLFNAAMTNVFPWPRPQITCGNPLGTWSLSFLHDTNVTLTTPCGTSTNFNIPPDVAALFADACTVYLGVQPNGASQFGKRTVLSHFKISNGATTMLEDDFTAPTLDAATWVVRASDANGITQVPPDAAYWVGWSLPDVGYSLQTTTNLTDPNSWITLTGPLAPVPLPTTVTKLSGNRMWVVPSSALGSPNVSYFRLLLDH
ncbi:MAG: hypothetical protein JWR69_3796 [Pedosphaera sp.]|nr:hypothetical protein [Pedosphaera sp.]